MKQIVIIHGGNSFSSHKTYIENLKSAEISYEKLTYRKQWKSQIAEQLPDTDVLLPTFPNGYNARYEEWKIYFEKIIPFLGNDVQLVGHSLGAMFLAKYLHDSPLSKKVRKLILIAGAYNDKSPEESDEFLVHSATKLENSALAIHLFHSKDDPVVPFSELAKFQADLPNAVSHVFENRGHFNDATFPELLTLLKTK